MKAKICLVMMLCSYNCLAQGSQLWGMTWGGGANDSGTIFNINDDGTKFNTVYSFTKSTGTLPWGDLLEGNNNKLYGMTNSGGVKNVGVIFSFDLSNDSITKEYDFDGANGAYPYGSLIQAKNGKLYGMTTGGGVNGTSAFLKGDGVIFCFDFVTNKYSKLYDFDSINGEFPNGNLLQAKNGKLYGMTQNGGAYGGGVIFSFDTSTNAYTKLYDFEDFLGPQGTLIQANNGKIYGMTYEGGPNFLGNIFSFDISTNSYTDLFDFSGTDGGEPYGDLLQASNGLFYGMTELGNSNKGTIFSFDTLGNIINPIFDFNGTNGAYPQASLMQSSGGKLFGMTPLGGNDNTGTIFTIDPANNNTFSKVLDFSGINGIKPWGNLIQLNATDINEISDNKNQLSIYPNPSTGVIGILCSKDIDTLIVTNLIGQLIYKSQPKQKQFTFNVNATGMYFVTVTSDNEIMTKKVVVLR